MGLVRIRLGVGLLGSRVRGLCFYFSLTVKPVKIIKNKNFGFDDHIVKTVAIIKIHTVSINPHTFLFILSSP